jgi:hypothetical protein
VLVAQEEKKQGAGAASRQELINRPGAERAKIQIRSEQVIPWPKPTQPELELFRQMLGGAGIDDKLIRKVARWEIARFTDPAEEPKLTKNRDDVVRRFGNNNNKEEALKKYAAALVAGCEELFKLNPPVAILSKVNALLLLSEMHAAIASNATLTFKKEINGVKLFVEVLEAWETNHPSVTLVAAKVFVAAKRLGITPVVAEKRAASAMFRAAKQADQQLLLEGLVITLGELGWVFVGNVPERAEIGTFLAEVALNENLPPRTRIEAAVSLGNMKVENLQAWNFDVQALVIAKAFAFFGEWAVAELGKQPAVVGKATIRWLGFRLVLAIEAMEDQARKMNVAVGEDRAKSLLTAADPLIQNLLDDKNLADEDVKPIRDWVKQNIIQPLRLTPKAEVVKITPLKAK